MSITLKNCKIILVACFGLFCFSLVGQNKYKNKQRSGYWITYYDKAKSQLEIKGKYKNGIQRGKWLYYSETGKLEKKEIYRKQRIKVTHYFPTGNIQRKGNAKLFLSDTLYHYYFTGEWKSYTTKGELFKKQYYLKGEMKSEILFKTSEIPMFNDSLTKAIRMMFTDYYKYNDSAKYIYTNYGKLTDQYLRMKKLEATNDSSILSRLDAILAKFGYPSKEIVGEEYTTPFFLISSYTIATKDKYYDLIINAAENGVLDKKDVAFFVDKVKVAHQLPQVYGTQFVYQKDIYLYYPIENANEVNSLRTKVGLDELDLNELKFTKY